LRGKERTVAELAAINDKWLVDVGVIRVPPLGGVEFTSTKSFTLRLFPSSLGDDEISAPGLIMFDRAMNAAKRKRKELTNPWRLCLPSNIDDLPLPFTWRPFQLIFGASRKAMNGGEECVLTFRFREGKWEDHWYGLYYEHWDRSDLFVYTDTETDLDVKIPT